MATTEILKGIHRTLDRMDARFEQSERRWEQSERRWEERDREHRRFQSELLERHAGLTTAQIRALEEMRDEIAESRAGTRAQTEALMKLIDRLPGDRPQG